ncbi:urease accessory protein UreF [Steroidobacter sp. S1-65]|uniref:Urease accessory protein UreF n=1 Tax=Steroidobacter gossypii TaxID=2805490 RepID=A0ABS1WUY1_9GAMM|nr:urease accessory protein UreF [Steroidobacter gossypii]MBM0104781.1 urease accessory protein UreF [Steroidobacter gossypii]
MHTDRTRLLRILHLASPALPIGAFHFSQGLEYAVEAGWIKDEAGALEWIGGVAQQAIATLDLPVLLRLHRACVVGDANELQRWNRFLLAARETEELRAEDRHMGAALARILRELGAGDSLSNEQPASLGYAAMFAFACANWNVSEHEALQAYAWTWAENQVLAAVKLVPLGQSAGQRILHSLVPRLEQLATQALSIQEEDIGACAIVQGLASARHESQYTRLFRS